MQRFLLPVLLCLTGPALAQAPLRPAPPELAQPGDAALMQRCEGLFSLPKTYALARHWIDAWNSNSTDRVMALYAPDFEFRAVGILNNARISNPTGILHGQADNRLRWFGAAKEKSSRRSLLLADARLTPVAPVTAVVPAIARTPTVPAGAHHNRGRAIRRRTVIHRRRGVIRRRRRGRVVDRRRRRIVHRRRCHIHRRHRHAKPDADAHMRRRHPRHGQHCQCGCTCNPQHIASNHLHHLRLGAPGKSVAGAEYGICIVFRAADTGDTALANW